ncbi:MAG: hypothetical protein ABI876_13665 [Bacteroidota bacterium]
MKSLTLISCIAIMLTAAACADSVVNNVPDPAPTFKNSEVTLSAMPENLALNRITTITTHCLPTVTAKGWIGLKGQGEVNLGGWILAWPASDTITLSETSRLELIPAEFTANQPFEQEWDIIPYPQFANEAAGPYDFTGAALIDSIYIADSARYYPVESEIVKRYSPGGAGYISHAINGVSLHINP